MGTSAELAPKQSVSKRYTVLAVTAQVLCGATMGLD